MNDVPRGDQYCRFQTFPWHLESAQKKIAEGLLSALSLSMFGCVSLCGLKRYAHFQLIEGLLRHDFQPIAFPIEFPKK